VIELWEAAEPAAPWAWIRGDRRSGWACDSL